MKLSELKKIAKECGYEIEEERDYFFKRNNNVIELAKKSERRIWINNSRFCSDKDFKMMEACIEFAKTPIAEREDILNDEEHEYLKAVIRPFRNEIEFIEKDYMVGKGNYNHIYLQLKYECIKLPKFKTGTMYKNMKLCKKYTLEELNL